MLWWQSIGTTSFIGLTQSADPPSQLTTSQLTLPKITLADFDCLGGLGMGAFGTVHLVRPSRQARWKQPRGFLAIKEQQKDEVFKDLHQTEINICRDVRGGPFLGQLLASFQNSDHLYILLEYYNGGSLLQHIKARTVFNGRQMALLAAELSVAILYLQNNSIVHRDIKPDNVIFDGNGHSKIIDFGVACYEWWDSPSIQEPMGTSIYLAPEMFKEPVLYNGMVDWWALGVTLLALVHKVDPMDLFEGPLKSTGQQKRGGFRIDPGLTHFRLGMYSQPLKTFIKGLLMEDPAHRLGAEGERQIRKQRLFHAGGILSVRLVRSQEHIPGMPGHDKIPFTEVLKESQVHKPGVTDFSASH
ncbi:protein kinase C alpha type-like [Babylonia areolata]|uniref:protein kinase C alpha type-like n=1 Tax=Babylonia areolata TaxID=304850 RepID=UPI003FD405F1